MYSDHAKSWPNTMLQEAAFFVQRIPDYGLEMQPQRLQRPHSETMLLTSGIIHYQWETAMPMCHRYQAVEFYSQDPETIQANRGYYRPWLKLQLTYHASHTMLNHPFLYSSTSRNGYRYAPSGSTNTFWRKSMGRVLAHATWITKMLELTKERGLDLTDPFFANASALAATFHLYYCCTPSHDLQQKSRANLTTSLAFMDAFSAFSSCCKDIVGLIMF